MSRRLFFALWPDNKIRSKIASITSTLPDGSMRIIPAKNLHLTLLFLGQVEESRLTLLLQQADGIQARRFHLTLDCTGWWTKPGVLWLGPTAIPGALFNLAEALLSLDAINELTLDNKPFKPHVTLARKVRSQITPAPFKPLIWHCTSFALLQSVSDNSGVEYLLLKQWPLLCRAS